MTSIILHYLEMEDIKFNHEMILYVTHIAGCSTKIWTACIEF